MVAGITMLIPIYNVTMTLHFPSGYIWQGGIGYDADKQVFVHQLIEDDTMREHYPEEFAKATPDKSAWNSKWDDYRLEASKIFALLYQEGHIEIYTEIK